ncbi:MAG: MFS transporter [Gammaproteobacteria bacterium]|jgi:glycoside/pentoside/hexuronide:cation symporter, GPH family|nr:MFS transporter [Gammaproteobacteria bacterium]MBT4493144.1 MFS transporter [Gammaproteobacteria bacterium]MBT7371782.1 MFS transporter [Gammaproteobacteria bacterium]
MSRQPLNNRTLFFYGLADVPVMLAIIPMSLYMNKFYATDVGIDLADLAGILLLARIFDLITDPLVGYLSDHTKTRWGRRKPWILASLPFLMMGIYKIFLPEPGVDIWYVAGWLLVMWLGWTMLMIPYYAWGAELSTDYDERTRVTAWRAAMGSFGMVLSIGIPLLAVLFFDLEGIAGIMRITGIAVLILIPIAVGMTLFMVEDKPHTGVPAIQMFDGLLIMMRNGLFRRLIFAFMLSSLGMAVLMPMNAFYIVSVLEAPEKYLPILMFFTSIISLFAIPMWVKVSERVGKHRAWAIGLMVVLVVSPTYLFLGPGQFLLMVPFALVSAIGIGAFQALPNSMKADVIDIDTARTGENRAAMFFSAWSLATKAAGSIGGSLGLYALSFIGFDAGPGAVNTPEAIMGLKYSYALMPAVIFVLAGLVVWNYPLTKVRQKRIRDAIDRRDARRLAAAEVQARVA